MSYIPSDNARCYIQGTTRMITYTAIPVDIPGVYQTVLMQLGQRCLMTRGQPSYVNAQHELDLYERKLRAEFGQLVTREEFWPKVWNGRDDAI